MILFPNNVFLENNEDKLFLNGKSFIIKYEHFGIKAPFKHCDIRISNHI